MLIAVLAAIFLSLWTTSDVAARQPVRVAVLKFGTVNWELATLLHHGLDRSHQIDLKVIPYASSDATVVALLAGGADVIVSDWLFVSRQRDAGRDFVFVPYSTAVGSLMVAADSPITGLRDATGLRIGVAGGKLDKNWLIVQAYATDILGKDLAGDNEIIYGAPPLLAQKARRGEVDAVLNYWHYSARLEASGFRSIGAVQDAVKSFGASGPVSAIGYVFSEAWAQANPEAVEGFVRASYQAKMLLKRSDDEWLRLRKVGLIRDDEKTTLILRDRFRQGIPARTPSAEADDAALVFRRLAKIGGRQLVGDASEMAPGTYWQNVPGKKQTGRP
ncbi:MAG: ABC transporter substrate-binding protein [Burkholderiaceae bacterium]